MLQEGWRGTGYILPADGCGDLELSLLRGAAVHRENVERAFPVFRCAD